MKPAWALHKKAQVLPNSSEFPKRPAGFSAAAVLYISSSLTPADSALTFRLPRSLSVSKGPGSKPLIVTPSLTVSLAIPAQNPVKPILAPFDSPRIEMGDFTAAEVMLIIRPNFLEIISSTVNLINSIAVSMFASTAFIQSSLVQSLNWPGGGPPALLTRMSTGPEVFNAISLPSLVVISQATPSTLTLYFDRISFAVLTMSFSVLAHIVKLTPASANASAQPLPRPLLAAQTSAFLPCIPKSIFVPF